MAPRVLMAHAQKLSEQVKSLTSRVRELETALQNKSNDDTGFTQLLSVLAVDPEVAFEDDLNSMSETIGSLSIGHDGQAKYHGESAGSEVGRFHTHVLCTISICHLVPARPIFGG
jgi:hypothetical protein